LDKIEVDVEVNYKGINDRLDRIVKHTNEVVLDALYKRLNKIDEQKHTNNKFILETVTLLENKINENHTTIFGIAKKLEERINENHTNLQLWATNITTHLNNRR